MYCVIDARFECEGSLEQAAEKFNAMLSDLKALLEKHPGVNCPMFDDDDWPRSADDIRYYPESDLEFDDAIGDDGGE